MYWFWDWIQQNRAGYVGSGVVFSGDALGTLAAGTTPLTLSTTGVGAGTYGGPTVIPRFDIDAKGRVLSGTNAGTLGTFGGFNSLVGAGDLLGTTTTNTFTGALSTTGVAAGTYSNPTLTVDAKGRITIATSGAASAGYPSNLITGTTTVPDQQSYTVGQWFEVSTSASIQLGSDAVLCVL